MAGRPTVFFQGADGPDATYWSWEWEDGSDAGYVVLPNDQLEIVATLLAAALPNPQTNEELTKAQRQFIANNYPDFEPHFEYADGKEPTPDVLALGRCFTGPLCQPAQEREFAHELSQLLLPPRLINQIRARCTTNRGLLRIFPAASCHAVPWELLATGRESDVSDERLLDLVDVTMVAPPLTRDGSPETHIDWSRVRGLPAFKLVDPPLIGTYYNRNNYKQVLAEGNRDRWRETAGADGIVGRDCTGADLSARLQQQRSRLLYVGHVEQVGATMGDTAILLSDEPLRARTLLAGAFDPMIDYTDEERFPPSSRSTDGDSLPTPGKEIWPMPPRVALIACKSGTDVREAEPFGLVIAALETGAELVTSTRWTLPTDFAFGLCGAAQPICKQWGEGPEVVDVLEGPFDAAAHAIDELHETDDPLAGFSRWQRERLEAWRANGRLADAPVIWAALMNYVAQDRSAPAPVMSWTE